MVGRGAACGDLDGDGDLDLVLTENNGPVRYLRNDGGNRQRWLRVTLKGTRSNRSGIGATVTATLAGGAKRWGMVKTGSSYLSQSELPLTFGLGAEARVAGLEVRWPSGQVDTIGSVDANRAITIVEGKRRTVDPAKTWSRRAKAARGVNSATRAAAPVLPPERASDGCGGHVPRFMLLLAATLAAGLGLGPGLRATLGALGAGQGTPAAPAPAASREDAYRANNVGVALLEQYNHADAAKSFRRALEIDPTLGLAKINLAIALFYVPDLAAAAVAAKEAAAAAPDAPQPHYILGLIAKSENQADVADAEFGKVLAIDGTDLGARVNLAQLAMQKREYDRALRAAAAGGRGRAVPRDRALQPRRRADAGRQDRGRAADDREVPGAARSRLRHRVLEQLPRTGTLRRSGPVDRRRRSSRRDDGRRCRSRPGRR